MVADTGCLSDGKQPVGRGVRLRGLIVPLDVVRGDPSTHYSPTHSPTVITTLPCTWAGSRNPVASAISLSVWALPMMPSSRLVGSCFQPCTEVFEKPRSFGHGVFGFALRDVDGAFVDVAMA